MIIKRLLILQAVLAVGLGAVYLIPTKSGPGKAGISLVLPKEVGLWTSKEMPISPQELTILAGDTGFARRLYTNPFGDEVSVGIVLSGNDMANSIHRPERCLPAQGWTVLRSDRVAVPIQGAGPLQVTKLFDVAERKVESGQMITFRNLTYYWFVGANGTTPSHLARTAIDIKDRILHGENQRWAYVTVASTVTDNLKRFGRTEAQTAEMIQSLIGQIVPMLQRPDQPVG